MFIVFVLLGLLGLIGEGETIQFSILLLTLVCVVLMAVVAAIKTKRKKGSHIRKLREGIYHQLNPPPNCFLLQERETGLIGLFQIPGIKREELPEKFMVMKRDRKTHEIIAYQPLVVSRK